MKQRGLVKFRLNGEIFQELNEHSSERFIAIAKETWQEANFKDYFAGLATLSSTPEKGLILSSWNPYRNEFGWSSAAEACNCLRTSEFQDLVTRLHTDTFMNTPWPTSHALLVDRKSLSQLLSNGDSVEISKWLQFFPLGSHYSVLSSLDLSIPQQFINLEGPGLLKNWVSKQLSNFTGGIIPREIGSLTRSAWIEDRKSRLGSTWIFEEKQNKVLRTIQNLRGIQIEESFCCTRVTEGKPTMFLTPAETLALSSS
jgi:hypothetical protein